MVTIILTLSNPPCLPSLPPFLSPLFLSFFLFFHSSSFKEILQMQFYFLFHLLMALQMYSVKILAERAYVRTGKFVHYRVKVGKTMSKCRMRLLFLHLSAHVVNLLQVFSVLSSVTLLCLFFLLSVPFHFSQLHQLFLSEACHLSLSYWQ